MLYNRFSTWIKLYLVLWEATMAPKNKTRKREMKGRGKNISKNKGPKAHKSPSPDTETPPQLPIEQNNMTEEISLTRLKTLDLKNDPTLKSLKELLEDRQKNSGGVLTDEDLDRTQWYFESLMSSIMFRKITIQNDLASLKSLQLTSSKGPSTNDSCASVSRPRVVETVPIVHEVRPIKSTEKPRKNQEKFESDNKFWSLVKPYLAHVNKNSLKWLEELVLSYENIENLYNIPPLGEHYSKIQTQEELKKQNDQTIWSQPPIKKPMQVLPNVEELVKRINHITHNDDFFRQIYQRVASALLEHSNMSLNDIEEKLLNYEKKKDTLTEMNNPSKEFNTDQNVEKQSHTSGSMNCNSKPVPLTIGSSSYVKSDGNDEIADEINKCNIALSELQKVNKNNLTNLLKRCREDYSQQKTYKNIKKVENEILNFKRRPNILLSNDEKIAQFTKENDEMESLICKRNKFLTQLQFKKQEPEKYIGHFFSDDSESSDEETNVFPRTF